MFYSHDILSNSQHGVATIWLAATVSKGTAAGNGAFRRLTRKAVQGVNVPKACETIIDPGAPLALRLQGSLLYGISRVFAQQCGYMLSDAEKTQSDMMTFFRVLKTSETDPHAGKTKRHLIMLEDDPAFDLSSALPDLELLQGDKELFGVPSQGSVNKFSQLTPHGGSSQSFSSTSNQPLLPFDLPSSSQCGGTYRLPSDFGHHSSPLAKHHRESNIMPEFQPFGDDELDPINGIGLDFDGDGNLVGIIEEEPELPPLPGASADRVQHFHSSIDALGEPEEHPVLCGGDELVLMGEDALPDADAFPVQSTRKQASDSHAKASETTETTETEQASAKNCRGRRRKAQIMLDQTDHISRAEFRSWHENYVENMHASRKRVKTTTRAQAKKNALALLYGNRIAGIGIGYGVFGASHPLAEEFAGKGLKARLQVLDPDEVDYGVAEKRGRRRKSPEAFEDEHAEEEGRRNVKQRVDEGAELGRGDGELLVFGDESALEIGMNAAARLDDRHSSSMMPWIQPASVIRGQGSAQKAAPSPSPLHGRGSVIGSIERHSDPVRTPLGAAGYGLQNSSTDFSGAIGALDFGRGNETQASGVGLDVASQEFLGYATKQAEEKGVTRDDDEEDRRWIDFDELANPETHSKAVAAQAFLHVLSLASKSSVAVEQDGADDKVPFGTIRISIAVARGRVVSVDELA
ncbi:Meiotic recombination protein rec8 [Tolypocladium ophioglossoides CBS 100239]|uniref:Meiotic recombination protein rec8 n=1 Tax=Tolypocladium ophioglossoides (strain CBS 100239) TaxID=1163406 RepID=A0A0L0N6Z0_TOLOC|nr:Meiotic recombination protein rec8 [Tolypocladium ophioglossoides CBS 100239]